MQHTCCKLSVTGSSAAANPNSQPQLTTPSRSVSSTLSLSPILVSAPGGCEEHMEWCEEWNRSRGRLWQAGAVRQRGWQSAGTQQQQGEGRGNKWCSLQLSGRSHRRGGALPNSRHSSGAVRIPSARRQQHRHRACSVQQQGYATMQCIPQLGFLSGMQQCGGWACPTHLHPANAPAMPQPQLLLSHLTPPNAPASSSSRSTRARMPATRSSSRLAATRCSSCAWRLAC